MFFNHQLVKDFNLFYFESCPNNRRKRDTISSVAKLTLTSQNTLNPKAETQLVLLMAKLSPPYTIALLDGVTDIPINSTDACVIYNTYGICINNGVCQVVNNSPSCICPVYSTYTYTGTYCETQTTVKSTVQPTGDTLLVVAIVLPIVGFLVILILTIITFIYWYTWYV